MYCVYFDSGTTNTRAYLIKDGKILDMIKSAIGSKDSSIAGSNTVLLKELKALFDGLLYGNGIDESIVDDIYASGMVTSPFGIKEIPHISTPVSGEKLLDGIYKHYEPFYLKRDVKLIRGVKTITDDIKANPCTISDINNMRGEEIEVFGVIPHLPPEWQNEDIAVFLPGSHTHVAYVRNNELIDIWSTFSGELFHAISTGTILSNSVLADTAAIDPQMLILGLRYLEEYGFNRALYICHAMKIFDAADNAQRKSYLEGVIIGGILLGFEKMVRQKWVRVKRIVVAGRSSLTGAYEVLLKNVLPHCTVMTISADEKHSFAVQGFMNILFNHKAIA
jgi:2-keto-3-deoxy-galactonokinase